MGTRKRNTEELMARRQVAVVDNGVAFAFGAAEPRLSEVEKFADAFSQISDDIIENDKQLIIAARASSPGSSDFNYELSAKRGEWVRDFLVDKGVDPSNIRVVPQGERYAQQLGDSPYDRVALLKIEEPSENRENENLYFEKFLDERSESIAEVLENGRRRFNDGTEPFKQLVRDTIAMPDNPAAADPSANPLELARQAGSIAIDSVGEAANIPTSAKEVPLWVASSTPVGAAVGTALKAVEWGSATFAELARSNLADDLAAARAPMWDALAEAWATSFFPDYRPNLDNMDDKQRALFDAAVFKIDANFTELAKFETAVYLANKYRTTDLNYSSPTWEDFFSGGIAELDAKTIVFGARTAMSGSEYRYRSNDPGERLFFPLKFFEVDGLTWVADAFGNVLEPADGDEVETRDVTLPGPSSQNASDPIYLTDDDPIGEDPGSEQYIDPKRDVTLPGPSSQNASDPIYLTDDDPIGEDPGSEQHIDPKRDVTLPGPSSQNASDPIYLTDDDPDDDHDWEVIDEDIDPKRLVPAEVRPLFRTLDDDGLYVSDDDFSFTGADGDPGSAGEDSGIALSCDLESEESQDPAYLDEFGETEIDDDETEIDDDSVVIGSSVPQDQTEEAEEIPEEVEVPIDRG